MRRITMSEEELARVKLRLGEITKQLRRWPYPIKPQQNEIEQLLAELEGIAFLNTPEERRAPVRLLDRAVALLHRAQTIRSRLDD